MKELNKHTRELVEYVYANIGSLPLMFDAKGKSQKELEEITLNQLKGDFEDVWFETSEDGSRQLYIKPSPAVEELIIKIGGTI